MGRPAPSVRQLRAITIYRQWALKASKILQLFFVDQHGSINNMILFLQVNYLYQYHTYPWPTLRTAFWDCTCHLHMTTRTPRNNSRYATRNQAIQSYKECLWLQRWSHIYYTKKWYRTQCGLNLIFQIVAELKDAVHCHTCKTLISTPMLRYRGTLVRPVIKH